VWRVEFEFHRTALNEMGLSDPTGTLDRVDRLWAYATGDWLTYRNPVRTRTRSSLANRDEWERIQALPSRRHGAPDGPHPSRPNVGELRRLMPGLNGYVAGFASWTGHDSIEDACAALPEYLRAYEQHLSVEAFADRVAEKRRSRP
jgi:hypothetical protein